MKVKLEVDLPELTRQDAANRVIECWRREGLSPEDSIPGVTAMDIIEHFVLGEFDLDPFNAVTDIEGE